MIQLPWDPDLPDGVRELPVQVEVTFLGLLVLLILLGWRLPGFLRSRIRVTSLRVGLALALALGLLALVNQFLERVDRSIPRVYHADGLSFWRLAPNQVNVRNHDGAVISTNSLGLREVEVGPERAPGEFRILCLGDSFTYGWGVAQDQTWPKLLQRELRRRSPSKVINVVNAGLPGYSSFQAFYLLRQILPRYRPDLLLVGGLNTDSEYDVPAMEEALPSDPWLRRILLIARQAPLYRVLRKLAYRLGVARRGDWAPVVRPFSDLPFETRLRYMTGLVDLAREAGVPVALFQHPQTLDFGGRPEVLVIGGELYIRAPVGARVIIPGGFRVLTKPGVPVRAVHPWSASAAVSVEAVIKTVTDPVLSQLKVPSFCPDFQFVLYPTEGFRIPDDNHPNALLYEGLALVLVHFLQREKLLPFPLEPARPSPG